MKGPQPNIELRIMPSGNGGWYWEVVAEGRKVITRGIAHNEPVACQDASDAAREGDRIAQQLTVTEVLYQRIDVRRLRSSNLLEGRI